MSHITDIIISGEFYNYPKSDIDNQLPYSFNWIDGSSVGGDLVLATDMLFGSFNRLDREKFVEAVKGLKNVVDEYDYKNIQVFIKNEQIDTWSVYGIEELKKEHIF